MTIKTTLQHVALEFNENIDADIFFIKILGLSLKKKFFLSNKLSKDIFGVNQKTKVHVYSNDKLCFEIFFTIKSKINCYDHICIKVDDKEKLIKLCEKYNIKKYLIKKDEKTLLFIKDHSNNLYEIK